MKKIILFSFFVPIGIFAQKIATAKQANRAVLQVEAFDKDHKSLQTTQGYFCSEKGEAIVPFSLMKGAYRIALTDYQGTKYEAQRVVGASSQYDLLRLTTNAPTKQIYYLPSRGQSAEQASTVYQTFYTTASKQQPVAVQINNVESTAVYRFYHISTPNKAAYIGTPLVNEKGELVAIVQRNMQAKDTTACAIAAHLTDSLYTKTTSIFNRDLKALHLPKQLPLATETAAFSYLYMLLREQRDSAEVAAAAADFLTAYPKHLSGKTELAYYYTKQGNYAAADALLRPLIEKRSESWPRLAEELATLILQKHQQHDSATIVPGWTLEEALRLVRLAKIEEQAQDLFLEANLLEAMGNIAEAAQHYEALSKDSQAAASTFFRLAALKRKLGASTEEMYTLYDSCVHRLSRPYQREALLPLYYRSLYAQETKRYRQAAEDLLNYEQLMGWQNLPAEFYDRRAACYWNAKMYKQATDDAAFAVTKVTSSTEKRQRTLELAQAYLTLSEFQYCLDYAQMVLKEDAQNTDALKLLGVAYGEMGDKLKAVQHLQRALKLGDESARSLMIPYQSSTLKKGTGKRRK